MDRTAEMLTNLKNAVDVGKSETKLPNTKMNRSVLEILKRERFIEDFEERDGELFVQPAYDESGPIITAVEKISKPGRRMYVGYKDLKMVLSGRGVGIISTSEGLMSIEEAKKKKLGGEYICKVW